MQYALENQEKFREIVIATAISDLLAIRIFNAQRDKHLRIAFFYYFRQLRRSHKYAHLSNKQLRIKIVGMLCKRLKKINLFAKQAEEMFGYTEKHLQMLHRVKNMSIIEVGQLKRKGVIFTKIEIRSKTIIVL